MASTARTVKRVAQKIRDEGNRALIEFIHSLMREGTTEVASLRLKLRVTYWLVVILTVIMFCVGIALLAIPAIGALKVALSSEAMNSAASVQQLIAAITGLADLSVLFLAKPIRQIHNLMGDISQLTMIINSFRYQVGLRLLEMNSNEPDTIGLAADKINEAAQNGTELVESYFEKVKEK